MTMITKSIRWRLQLWLAFLLVCILSGFGVTAYQLHRTNRLNQVQKELERRVSALSGDVRALPPFGPHPRRPPFEPGPDFPPPRRGGPEPGQRGSPGLRFGTRDIQLSDRTLSLLDQPETNSFYYAVWSRSGNVLKRSTNAPVELSRPERPEAAPGIHARIRGATREAFLFTEIGECVLAGRVITAELDALRRFACWLALAGGAVLALGLGGGWLLATRAIRPLEDISVTASRISAGNLSERINLAETDSELGRLAGVLNSTFARLEAAFAQQKQFTADAAHELRTPLAVIISEAQTALARQRSAAEYRETVEACLDTAQSMKRLAQSLLELSRFDAGQARLERTTFDLAERTQACVELIRPLAEKRGISLRCDLAPTEALGDVDRICQVIVNLLNNAVDYNRDQGEIHVATRSDNGLAVVVVADTGPGIAPEDLPHVFERFYRGEKSRARPNGQCGLGLAICKAIVDAHGGSIEVSSEPAKGARFKVRLPT